LDRTLSTIGWCVAGVGGATGVGELGAAWWAVARGPSPLGDLSQRVQAISPDKLGTRLATVDLPIELRPVADQ